MNSNESNVYFFKNLKKEMHCIDSVIDLSSDSPFNDDYIPKYTFMNEIRDLRLLIFGTSNDFKKRVTKTVQLPIVTNSYLFIDTKSLIVYLVCTFTENGNVHQHMFGLTSIRQNFHAEIDFLSLNGNDLRLLRLKLRALKCSNSFKYIFQKMSSN